MLRDEATNPPPPPWQLQGSAIVSLANWRAGLGLINYTHSPVGSYDEVAVFSPTWRGPSVTAMWVTSALSLRGGRENWGYPKQLASLHWQQDSERIVFRAGTCCWRWRVWGPRFPIGAVGWTVQTLHDATVRVPVQVTGRARFAWRGRQLGLYVAEFTMTVAGPEKL